MYTVPDDVIGGLYLARVYNDPVLTEDTFGRHIYTSVRPLNNGQGFRFKELSLYANNKPSIEYTYVETSTDPPMTMTYYRYDNQGYTLSCDNGDFPPITLSRAQTASFYTPSTSNYVDLTNSGDYFVYQINSLSCESNDFIYSGKKLAQAALVSTMTRTDGGNKYKPTDERWTHESYSMVRSGSELLSGSFDCVSYMPMGFGYRNTFGEYVHTLIRWKFNYDRDMMLTDQIRLDFVHKFHPIKGVGSSIQYFIYNWDETVNDWESIYGPTSLDGNLFNDFDNGVHRTVEFVADPQPLPAPQVGMTGLLNKYLSPEGEIALLVRINPLTIPFIGEIGLWGMNYASAVVRVWKPSIVTSLDKTIFEWANYKDGMLWVSKPIWTVSGLYTESEQQDFTYTDSEGNEDTITKEFPKGDNLIRLVGGHGTNSIMFTTNSDFLEESYGTRTVITNSTLSGSWPGSMMFYKEDLHGHIKIDAIKKEEGCYVQYNSIESVSARIPSASAIASNGLGLSRTPDLADTYMVYNTMNLNNPPYGCVVFPNWCVVDTVSKYTHNPKIGLVAPDPLGRNDQGICVHREMNINVMWVGGTQSTESDEHAFFHTVGDGTGSVS